MKRVATALVLIPLVVYMIFWAPAILFRSFVAIISLICGFEYSQILGIAGATRWLGLAAGAGLFLLPVDRIFLPMLLVALATLTVEMKASDLSLALAKSGAMFLGVFYIFGGWRTADLLHARGVWWLFFALSLNWIGDSGAYYVGRRWGKHKMAPRISPGKSWEGSAASLLFAMLYTVLVLPRIEPLSLPAAALIGLVGNAAGQLGDLAESALKRGAGVKDSGNLLPGHGGMLDRVDSALFTLPTVYALLNWFSL